MNKNMDKPRPLRLLIIRRCLENTKIKQQKMP